MMRGPSVTGEGEAAGLVGEATGEGVSMPSEVDGEEGDDDSDDVLWFRELGDEHSPSGLELERFTLALLF